MAWRLPEHLPVFSSIGILLTVVLSGVGLLFDVIMLILLSRKQKFMRQAEKSIGRRIGLLHSTNTYIHLTGILLSLFFMSFRTLLGDLDQLDRAFMTSSWHCNFLSYFLSLSAGGVYGSCFLQAIFRFCRVIIPHQRSFQKLPFHTRLIAAHWMLIAILLLPVIPRSVYIPHDYFCITPNEDRTIGTYIVFITVLIPVTGIVIIYLKIVHYVRCHSRSIRRGKRNQRDLLMVRRTLILVIVIFQTSCSALVLWVFTIFDQRLQQTFYRLLRLIITLCMIIFSLALWLVSPQLKGIFRIRHQQPAIQFAPQKTIISSDNDVVEEITSTRRSFGVWSKKAWGQINIDVHAWLRFDKANLPYGERQLSGPPLKCHIVIFVELFGTWGRWHNQFAGLWDELEATPP